MNKPLHVTRCDLKQAHFDAWGNDFIHLDLRTGKVTIYEPNQS